MYILIQIDNGKNAASLKVDLKIQYQENKFLINFPSGIQGSLFLRRPGLLYQT